MESVKTGILEEKIRIEGMSCGSCSSRVQKALLDLKGVHSAAADHTKGEAVVRYDTGALSVTELHRAIVDAGYRIAQAGTAAKTGVWSRVKRALKNFKEELEKDSVGKSNFKPVDCCHPPEELIKPKTGKNHS